MNMMNASRPIRWALAAGLALTAGASAQTLTIGVRAGPDSIDPHFTATGTHAEALKHIFDTLVWSGDQLQIEPGLAESWKQLDPVTWEFKLRKGVKFHDGSEFTAQDVVFSIERIPVVTGANPLTIYVRRVQSTKIVDPHTLHITTNGPAPSLPYDFIRLFIVSHKAAAGLTKENANEAFNSGKAAIGTGPFKFVSWTPREQLTVDRNDDYWKGKADWQRVVRKEIPNDAARVAQLKAGQVDMIVRVPAADLPSLQRDARLSIAKADTVYVFNIEMDLREKTAQVSAKDGSALSANPFRDARVREAITLTIDRDALAEVAMEGLGKPVTQMVTDNIFGHNKSLPALKPNVARAKQLMAEAGYANGFKVIFNFTNDRLPGDRAVGTAVAQMLAQINLDVQANGQPGAVLFPARTRGDLSFLMSGWGTLTGEAHYTLSSLGHSNDAERRMGAFNWRGYKNERIDKVLQDAAIEMDDGKRRALLEEANAIFMADRPSLPLVAVSSAWAMQKDKVAMPKPRADEDTLAFDLKKP
jgi:peptide/nickel transport system substrate-binding protein